MVVFVFEETGEMDFVSVMTDVSAGGAKTGVLAGIVTGSVELLMVRMSRGRFTSSSESSLNSYTSADDFFVLKLLSGSLSLLI